MKTNPKWTTSINIQSTSSFVGISICIISGIAIAYKLKSIGFFDVDQWSEIYKWLNWTNDTATDQWSTSKKPSLQNYEKGEYIDVSNRDTAAVIPSIPEAGDNASTHT